jgi:uncharacterized protein YhfF
MSKNTNVPPAYAHLPQWAFGQTKEEADAACALVLDGKKTATAAALYHFEEEPPPEPGDKAVILDGSNRPRCVIEFTDVDATTFDEVDAKFALAEGEADGTLTQWRKLRKASLTREGYFAADMLLLCQYFRVIERLEFRRMAP